MNLYVKKNIVVQFTSFNLFKVALNLRAPYTKVKKQNNLKKNYSIKQFGRPERVVK